jgi:hypothetical protein
MGSYWEKVYYITKYIITFLYITSFFGLWNKSKAYLDIFNYFWQIILGSLLIILYNPYFFINSDIRQDAAFTSGFILLTNSNIFLIQKYGQELYDIIINFSV